MPKAQRKTSPAAAETVPEASTPAAAEAPATQPKRAKKPADAGKLAGRIIPGVGAIPTSATHYNIEKVAPDGRRIEKIQLRDGNRLVDEFPIEGLPSADVLEPLGPGRFRLQWIGVDPTTGQRKGCGKSKVITFEAPAGKETKPARPRATSSAEDIAAAIAEARQQGRAEAMRELAETVAFRDRMRDDGMNATLTTMRESFSQMLQLATAQRAPAAPSEDVQQLRTELAVMRARAEVREEFEDEFDDLREQLERRSNPNAEKTTLDQIREAATLLPTVLPLLQMLKATPAPHVAPPPAPPPPPRAAPVAKDEDDDDDDEG